jgi:hypothetical protein
VLGLETFVGIQAPNSKKQVYGRVLVCMLLIGLLLYNPFMALLSHGQAGLRTPERHRATVGSSEMQHFSPVQVENTHVDVEIVQTARIIVEPQKYPTREIEDIAVPRQPETYERLWVRPPPSL